VEVAAARQKHKIAARKFKAGKLKKNRAGLNVRLAFRDQCMWERQSLPIEAVYGASPSTPSAHTA
jgi:hypothetical protein